MRYQRCPGGAPCFLVVDLGAATIGVVTLDRRDAARPGHVRPEADAVELSYMSCRTGGDAGTPPSSGSSSGSTCRAFSGVLATFDALLGKVEVLDHDRPA